MSHPRRDASCRGQALIEFVLVAPLFLLLMFGLLELGRAVYYTQVLDNAARDGARYAIVHGFASAAFGECPSGPIPGGGSSCDPTGQNVIEAVQAGSVGVTNQTSALTVNVKWCDSAPYDPSECGDFDAVADTPVPCSEWSDLGDGTNLRNQIVTVCVQYRYDALLSFLPIPDFTASGRASLVVNN